MTTTIKNNQKVFMLRGTGWCSDQYFCNMADIVKCAKQFGTNQPYKIFHFWDGKQTGITRKKLIEWMEANQLDASYFKGN